MMPFYWRQHLIKQIDLSLSFVALYCKGCEIFNYSRPVMASIIESVRSLIRHQYVSKLILNSPILSNNNELNSMRVNKGRFDEELG